MALYNASGNFRVTVGDTTRTGIYAADGSLRVTIVSGSTYTGLFAADGSYNVVSVSATATPISLYHTCGALRGVAVSASASNFGAIAPNGALYMEGLLTAAAFAGSKTNVLSWCFDDTAGDMGSVVIRDTVTPANDFASANTAAILAKFTGWSATSPMMTRGPTGLLRYANHNLCPYAEQFNDASWVKFQASVTADSVVAPDGTTTADTLTGNGAAGVHNTYRQLSGYVANQQFRVSIYAKAGTVGNIALAFGNGTNVYISRVFNLTDGSLGDSSVGVTSGTLLSSSISAAGNGFYRCTIEGFINATNPYFAVSLSPDATGVSFDTGGGPQSSTSGSAYVWGYDIKLLPCHSAEYIKTTSAAVYSIPTTYDTSGNKLGFLDWEARTNAAWWSRDLTQSAHVKTNSTAYKTARGTDNELNSASRLVATAANGNVIQQITATSAQRVSSAKVRYAKGSGTVKMSQGETTGSELISNGAFGTDTSGWVAGFGTTSSTFTQASGQATLTQAGADTTPRFVTTISGLTVGKLYRIKLTSIGAVGAGDRFFIFTSSSSGTGGAYVISGFDFCAIATATTMYVAVNINSAGAGATWTIDDVSVKECTETSLSLNAVSYSEVSGTELVTNSGFDTDLTGWTDQDTGTGESSWVSGAVRLLGTDASNRGLRRQTLSLTPGKLYKLSSTHVVTSGSATIGISSHPSNTSSDILAIFTGTDGYFVAPSGATYLMMTTNSGGGDILVDNVSLKEVEPSQAWTEAETAAATITNPCVAIWCATSGDAIDVDHVQCEIGAKASPPIITAGAAVTRAASTFAIADSLYNWSGSAGTFVAWVRFGEVPANAGSRHIVNHGSDGYVFMSNGVSVSSSYDGTSYASTANSFTAGVLDKVAAAYGANKSIVLNGGTVANDAFDGTFGSGSTLYIGMAAGPANHANGIIHRIKYYPEDTADADLIAETV